MQTRMSAIWPWLICQCNEIMLMDLPSSVIFPHCTCKLFVQQAPLFFCFCFLFVEVWSYTYLMIWGEWSSLEKGKTGFLKSRFASTFVSKNAAFVYLFLFLLSGKKSFALFVKLFCHKLALIRDIALIHQVSNHTQSTYIRKKANEDWYSSVVKPWNSIWVKD